jgi:4-amino-4-deoxy-L-arabinose transferase-like glycosyltransferase
VSSFCQSIQLYQSMMFVKSRTLVAVSYAAMTVLLFTGLGTLPFQMWDEGRVLTNTIEMHQSESWLTTTFAGEPEFWNTKPGLLHWLQIASARMLGWTEWGLRFPSAFAVLLWAALAVGVSRRLLGDARMGALAGLIAVVLPGYAGTHAALAADYDALLSLWMMSAFLCFWLALERSPKWLFAFWVSLALAVLTKGIAGLLMSPGFLVLALVRNKVRPFMFHWAFWSGLIAFIVLAFGYYALREFYQPGYLQSVVNNELGGRFAQANEGHAEPVWFYVQNFGRHLGIAGVFLLGIGTVLGLSAPQPEERRLVVNGITVGILFLLVLSVARTKLDWYVVPLYPIWALIASVGWVSWFRSELRSIAVKRLMLVGFGILLLTGYAYNLSKQTRIPSRLQWQKNYAMSMVLKEVLNNEQSCPDLVVFKGYDTHIRLYVKLLQQNGMVIGFNRVPSVQLGQTILCQEPEVKAEIRGAYICDSVALAHGAMLYTVHQIRL